MTASPARSALRGLIRAVNRNVTNVAGNRQWRDFIIASAREQPSDPQLGHDRLVLAKDLTLLINNVKHHQARWFQWEGLDPPWQRSCVCLQMPFHSFLAT